MSFAGAWPLVERGIVRAGLTRYPGMVSIAHPDSAYHAFVYTVAGTASATVRGHAFALTPDTLWIAPASAPYEIATGDGEWETMWLELRPIALWRHLEAAEPHFRYSGQAQRMVHVMSGLIGESTSPRQDSAVMGRHFAEIFGLFIDRRLHRGGDIAEDDMRQRLGTMWERVGSDLQHPWTVGELAAELAVSPSHLHRVVQQIQGVTPMAFLTQLRMQRAQDFLAHTPLKLEAIAHRVGYVSAFALSKAFKRLIGISPQEYRRSQGTLL